MDEFLVRDARPADGLQVSCTGFGLILVLACFLMTLPATGATINTGPLLRTVDAGTRHDRLDHGGAQIMGGRAGERSVEAAHSGAPRRYDYHVGHVLVPLPQKPGGAHTALQHG